MFSIRSLTFVRLWQALRAAGHAIVFAVQEGLRNGSSSGSEQDIFRKKGG
jgi:hypothetical protein